MRYLFVALLLAGCVSPEERAARQQAYVDQLAWQCRSYGLHPGTDRFSQCMMQLDMMNQQNRAAREAATSAIMLQQGFQMMNQPPVFLPPPGR